MTVAIGKSDHFTVGDDSETPLIPGSIEVHTHDPGSRDRRPRAGTNVALAPLSLGGLYRYGGKREPKLGGGGAHPGVVRAERP